MERPFCIVVLYYVKSLELCILFVYLCLSCQLPFKERDPTMGTVLSTSISDPIMETDPPSVTTQNDFPSDQPTTADPIMETDPPSVTTQNDFPSDQPTTADPIMETDPPIVTTQNNTLSNETDAEVPVVPIAVGVGCTMLLIVGIIIVIVILILFRWYHIKHSFIVNEDGMMMNNMSLTGECILYVNIDK